MRNNVDTTTATSGRGQVTGVTVANSQFGNVPLSATLGSATQGQVTWQADNVPLAIGENTLKVTAEDSRQHVQISTVVVTRLEPVAELLIQSPEQDAVSAQATISVEGVLKTSRIQKQAVISARGVSITVQANGKETDFTLAAVPLNEGVNSIRVTAQITYADDTTQEVDAVVDVTYQPVIGDVPKPSLTVLSPVNGSTLSGSGFYLIGQASSYYGPATIRVNGQLVPLQGGQSQSGQFSVLLGFEEGQSQLAVDVVVSDALQQQVSQTLQYFRDISLPVIAVDQSLSADADNIVSSSPYVISGTVSDNNLVGFTVNGQSVGLTPGSSSDAYRFSVSVSPGQNGEAAPVVLDAVDAAGNHTVRSYHLKLDSTVTASILVPLEDTSLTVTGTATIPVQFAARLTGAGISAINQARVQVVQGEQVISQSDLQVASGLASGMVELPSASGEYELHLVLLDAQQQVLFSTSRTIALANQSDIELALVSTQPAADDAAAEPHLGVNLVLNRALADDETLQFTLRETFHGKTYQNTDEPGTDGVRASGYVLVDVHRDQELVPGTLSPVPGDRAFAFYPDREMAYNADLFAELTVTKAGGSPQRLGRWRYHTRPLPTFLEGGVVDHFGQPVAGLEVTLPELDRQATTNAEGAFEIGYGDAVDKALPAGRHTLVVNPGLRNPAFGTRTVTVTVDAQRRNRVAPVRLPALNKDTGFSTVSGGQTLVMAEGDVSLSLVDAEVLCPDGNTQCLAKAQFGTALELQFPAHPLFQPVWLYTVQPGGIQVDGNWSFELQVPAMNGNTNYLYPYIDPQRPHPKVLLLGMDQSGLMVPQGVAEQREGRLYSLRHAFTSLEALAVCATPPDAQLLFDAYIDGNLSLMELTLKLQPLMQQAQETPVPASAP